MPIISRLPLFALSLLLLFGSTALAGGPSNSLDVSVMRSMAALRAEQPTLTAGVAMLTVLGGAPVTLGLAGIASLVLLFRRASAHALILALIVLTERWLVDGLKDWIGRPRPGFGVDWLPQSLAYPSGHAANSMTAFLAVALIAAPPAYRRVAAVVAVALSILIGLTRIYLGVHWPSDVIGGWALGLLSVAAALAVGNWSGALKLQHEVVGRHRLPRGEDETA